jgi:hypothetical protein
MSPPVELHAGLRDQVCFDQRQVRPRVQRRLKPLDPLEAASPDAEDRGRPAGAQAIRRGEFYAKRVPVIEAMMNAHLPAIFYLNGLVCDYLLAASLGISAPLPAAAPRLGRRTVLTFPLFPPPQKN